MNWRQSGSAFRLLLVLCASHSGHAFAADWSLEVLSIEVDGVKVTQAELQVTAPQQATGQSQTVREGVRFALGSVIAVPARTTLLLRSSNSNSVRLLPGSRIRVLAGSELGEEFGQEAGRSWFYVRRALSFFNVRYSQFQAIVRATVFSVEVVPGKEITFAAEEGTVGIEREGKLRIAEGNAEGTITISETLNAGESKSFRLNIDEYLEHFKNFGEAEAYYRKNLEADQLSGDPIRIEAGLSQMGQVLNVLGRYNDAIPFFEARRKSALKRHPSGVHANIASSLMDLGNANFGLGDVESLKRAISYHNDSLKILRELYPGGVHVNIAASFVNLGAAYTRLGGPDNLRRAIDYYEDGLKLFRQLHPSGVNAGIALSLMNLGAAYLNIGGPENLRTAIRYLNDGLDIQRQLHPGGVHADIAGSLNNVGLAYVELGGPENLRTAIRYHNDGLNIRRQLHPGGVHADIAASLASLGLAYRDLGGSENLRSAIDYWLASMKILRQLYPLGVHPKIEVCLNNLGNAYRDLGATHLRSGGTDNLTRAISYYEDSLRFQLQLHPEGVHADIAATFNNLGMAYSSLGGTENLKRAISYIEDSLRTKRQLYPDGVDVSIVGSLQNLAGGYQALGGTENFRRAIGYYEDSLKIQRQLHPSGLEAGIAATLDKLSDTRLFIGQNTEALRDARAALQIAPGEIRIRSREAHALLLMGRTEEAMVIYARFREQPVGGHQTFRTAVLEDFAALRKAGVDHPGMAAVEALYAAQPADPQVRP